MLRRCNNKNHNSYDRYGGRGIKCLWKDYADFERDMVENYLLHIEKYGERQTTIDRINNDGNYCKENCKWSTWREQAFNKLSKRAITYNGETRTMASWARKIGIKKTTLWHRLNKKGVSMEEIFNTKVRKLKLGKVKYKNQYKTMTDWSRIFNISLQAMSYRLNVLKWSLDKTFQTKLRK